MNNETKNQINGWLKTNRNNIKKLSFEEMFEQFEKDNAENIIFCNPSIGDFLAVYCSVFSNEIAQTASQNEQV